MKHYNSLECVVRKQQAKGHKCHDATEITIFIGPVLVASKICGGRYNAEQGIAEFHRNHKSFVRGDGYEAALALKLIG
jgi:hypothetical protein